MKRVVIFSTAYAPLIGGAEIAVQELTDRLFDFEFVLITARLKPELPREEMIGRVKVIRVGNGGRFDKLLLWWTGWKVAEAEGEFAAVWGIMASYGGLAALRYKKKNPQVPFLLTLQEGDSFGHIYARAWFIWPWFKQIFTRANQVQAISNYLANWALTMGVKAPIKVVPNGVKIQAVLKAKSVSEVKRVITVSRLVEKNGIEYLIRAMSEMEKKVVLKILGTGKLENKLKKLISHLNLKDNVVLKGSVSYQEVYEYLNQADVFVRPSLTEGLGNSFLEAMAVGVPIIGTRVGGIPDFLEDGVTGWFSETKNPHDLAEKIKYVLDEKNKVSVAQVVKNAQELVVKKYSWEVVTEQMKQILNTL